MPPCSCWTKAHLHSLEAGGSFQRPPCTGGQMGPGGNSYPEKKALSWADRSTVIAPHRGAKWFPFSGLFFFFFFATGPVGMGRVGSGVGQQLMGGGTWRRGKWMCELGVEDVGMSQQTCMCTDTLMLSHYLLQGRSVSTGFYLDAPPPLHTHKHSLSPLLILLSCAYRNVMHLSLFFVDEEQDREELLIL